MLLHWSPPSWPDVHIPDLHLLHCFCQMWKCEASSKRAVLAFPPWCMIWFSCVCLYPLECWEDGKCTGMYSVTSNRFMTRLNPKYISEHLKLSKKKPKITVQFWNFYSNTKYIYKRYDISNILFIILHLTKNMLVVLSKSTVCIWIVWFLFYVQ